MHERLRTAFALTLASLLTASCGEMAVTSPDEPIIEAEILRIELDGHPSAPRVLLGRAPEGEIWLSVTDATVLDRLEEDGTQVQLELDELEVGSWAQAWHSGPIMDSHPQQTEAAWIRVLGPSSEER